MSDVPSIKRRTERRTADPRWTPSSGKWAPHRFELRLDPETLVLLNRLAAALSPPDTPPNKSGIVRDAIYEKAQREGVL